MDNIVIKNTEARQELLEFLVEYRNWAMADAPRDTVFDKSLGLCLNLLNWQYYHLVYGTSTRKLLSDLFPPDNKGYPFNE